LTVSAAPSRLKSRGGPQVAARVSHFQIVSLLLTLVVYLALFRSTGINYGYQSYYATSTQLESGFTTALGYVVATLVIIYVVLDAAFILPWLLNSPTLLLCSGLLLITVIGSEEPLLSLKLFVTFAVMTFPVLAMVRRLGPQQAFDTLRKFCAFAVILNLIYSVAFPNYAFQGGVGGILRGMFKDKNTFGTFMVIAFIVTFPGSRDFFAKNFKIEGIIYMAAATIALGLALLSKSASVVIMLAACPVLCLVLWLILSLRNPHLASAAWLITVIAALFGILSAYVFYFEDLLAQLGRNATLSNRTRIWTALLRLVPDHPWLGHGFGVFSQPERFSRYWSEFGWEANSAHSSYIEQLLNLGYFPLAILALLLIKSVWTGVLNSSGHASLEDIKRQTLVIMILITGVTEASRFMGGSFFWLAFVICLFAYRRRKAISRMRNAVRPAAFRAELSPRLRSTMA
jgi:exopolysaccharide production protein ExoQ